MPQQNSDEDYVLRPGVLAIPLLLVVEMSVFRTRRPHYRLCVG